ncbi:peptidylprolyl isomerase [Gracilimonas halophila]|uniref:peptidylprolyl isomerase n=1 Tax=Gracilimonas halophila TaxID=1834464 RepID=A0ABW5JKQ2_9BACT
MYKLIIAGTLLLVVVSCNRETAYSKLLTDEYPELYTFVFERNADSLLSYTEHSNSFIRQQAWRGLISTRVQNIDEMITKVQYDNSSQAWTALSNQQLNDGQLSRLHDLWDTRSIMRNGISLVLGKQGNQSSLDYLVRNFEGFMDSSHEYETALTISRLMMNYELRETTKRSLLRYAAVLDEPDLFQAYFYGIYRSRSGVESDEMRNILWETYEWTAHSAIKQYSARILFNTDSEWFFNRLDIEPVDTMNPQLAIELAQHSGMIDWNEKLSDFYSKLLEHKNTMVNEAALNEIENHSEKPGSFDKKIIEKIINNEEKEASIRLSGIQSLSSSSEFLELGSSLADGNEYLSAKKLNIYQREMEADEYLRVLEDHVSSANTIISALSIQALSGWWSDLGEDQKNAEQIERIRSLLFDILERQDPVLTYQTLRVFSTTGLLESEDLEEFLSLVSDYDPLKDTEVFQVLGDLLMEYFKEEGKSVVTELAQNGNYELNNAFRDQGWEVDVQEQPKEFRAPNWERLGAMGYEPVWVLETEKGDIRIKMDVLAAPATISGLDSLTRAGAFDSVAFHRVVPNFVIQGGDIDTGLGWGGPDYTVPTEASEKEYRRGMAGMARTNIDTEGSQFFVMHQWKPHLNAGYTIIGEVVAGMEVVDRILYGDKVLRGYWLETE